MTKEERQFNGERRVFTRNETGVIEVHGQKNEPRHKPYTLHKKYLKMDHRPKCKHKKIKLLEER